MRSFCVVVLLLCSNIVTAQDAAVIIVDPQVVEEHHPITATLKVDTEIPDGATILAGKGWSFSDGVEAIEVDSKTVHIWAESGEHEISFELLWLHSKVITVIDKDGVEQQINSLLGVGNIKANSTFTVSGSEDEESPDPIKGSYLILTLRESSEITSQMETSELKMKEYLKTKNLTLLEMDPDQTQNPEGQWLKNLISQMSVKAPALVVGVIPENSSKEGIQLVKDLKFSGDVEKELSFLQEVLK